MCAAQRLTLVRERGGGGEDDVVGNPRNPTSPRQLVFLDIFSVVFSLARSPASLSLSLSRAPGRSVDNCDRLPVHIPQRRPPHTNAQMGARAAYNHYARTYIILLRIIYYYNVLVSANRAR